MLEYGGTQMAILHPFKGYRPTRELCAEVAALPYDVMNSSEAREMVRNAPYSFLHVDRAEVDLPEGVNIYSPEVYARAAANLNKIIDDGIYIQDSKPVLYVYRLTMDGRSQTGLVGCSSIDEYISGKIKKHELTRADKEQDRINHVDSCNANTGPIFLTYRSDKAIDEIISKTTSTEPEYDFTSDDNVRHTVWVIDDIGTIDSLVELFKGVDSLYIADGHHRNASAVKVGLKRREAKPDYTGDEEFNFYLSVLFPDNQLHIMDYNRVVRDLNGLSEEEFISALEKKFDITSADSAVSPSKAHTFGMYLGGKWYTLSAHTDIISEDAVEGLDVSILQNEVLSPILGIGDPRTDKRIDFVGGIRGLSELESRVDSGEMSVAFSMYPTSMSELMAIADADKIMPPKSTWFEPKLRSGIFIHKLD
jgi:uncharacterized protein (DUF1015 family)